MDSVFIISPLVGSLIGYWTNWLAIKMLFRPLTKKEIFGFKIPFTPGVIPRRRSELAESIGNTVGKRLLTPDAFEEILQGPTMKNKVQQFIKEKIKRLEDENRSIEQILEEVLTEQQEVKQIKKLLKKIIRENVEDSLTKENISQFIKCSFNSEKRIKEIENYFASDDYNSIRNEIINLVQNESTKEELKSQLTQYLKQELEDIDQDKPIKELIPDSLITSFRNWVDTQKPEVINHLISFLKSEALQKQIEMKVEQFFADNPMLSMLSGFKDKIVEKFLDYLVSYVEEKENQEQIMQEVDKLIDSLLQTSSASITEQLDETSIETAVQKVIEEFIKEENIAGMLMKLEGQLLEKLKTGQEDGSLSSLLNKVLTSDLMSSFLDDMIDFKIEQIFTTPLASYFKNLEPEVISQLENGIVTIIEYVMEHHLGAIFATLNFKKLVKEKINAFDVLEVERLLLDVIETELNAITWFGAVLGFLLGLITPVISLF